MNMNRLSFLFVAAFFFCSMLASSTQASAQNPDAGRNAVMPKKHAALFKQHCFDCHDSSSEEAGVNLESLSYEISSNIETAELWQKVLNAINSGEMPPKDAPQLADVDKAAFLEDLTNRMVVARKILGDAGGEITLRRLNQREYSNTIETLLGVTPDVSSLPTNQTGTGYDTQGASLFFSSDQLEQYLASANASLRLCLFPSQEIESKVRRVEPEEFYTPHYQSELDMYLDRVKRSKAWLAHQEKPPADFGFLDDLQAKKSGLNASNWAKQLQQYVDRPETKTGATLIMTIKSGGYTRIKLPVLNAQQPGKYLIRVKAGHYPDAAPRFHFLEFSSMEERQRSYLGWRRVTATLDQPEILEFPVGHHPGKKLSLQIHQRTHQDRGDKNLWTIDMKKNGVGTPPGVWVDWAELVGPISNERPIQAMKTILFEKPSGWDTEKYAAEVIRRFAMRAFRGKQPDEKFLQRVVEHFKSETDKGKSLKEALITPLAIVLTSPQFLYLVEEDDADSSTASSSIASKANSKLTPMEVAVRLSYLLWSSPPDDKLYQLAIDGKLSDPKVLSEQTTRMLNDARSENFVRDFSHQWLEMDRLGMFQFDGVTFPTFDNAVRECARKEIVETFKHCLQEETPIGILLDADFVVINDVLADFYGIPDVTGHEFRKVPVPKDSPRGGLLGTAAILAMGSDGVRSSPVERGAWVLRHLLNDPPAPAPPNVPQLSRLDDEVLSVRELQKAHQEQPQCAQCHRKIDPIGYGMENFSADGLWREFETVAVGKRRSNKFKKFEIDASGELPDGEGFQNFQELRAAIGKHKIEFARGFGENLIAYGLGRPFGFSDQELSESILKTAQKESYSMKAFIHAFVQSETFQSR